MRTKDKCVGIIALKSDMGRVIQTNQYGSTKVCRDDMKNWKGREVMWAKWFNPRGELIGQVGRYGN